MDFFQTRMGQRFIEGTVPELVETLKRIVVALERIAEQRVQPANDIAGERVMLASEEDHRRAQQVLEKHAASIWDGAGGFASMRADIEAFFGASTWYAWGALITVTRIKRDPDGYQPQLKLFF